MRWNLQILNISLGIHSLTKAYDIYESLAEGGENCHFCKDVCHYKLYKTEKKAWGKKVHLATINQISMCTTGFLYNRMIFKSMTKILMWGLKMWPDCQVALSFSLPLSLRGCDLPEWALSPHPLGCMKNSPGLPIRVSLNQGAGVTAATRMTLLSLGI